MADPQTAAQKAWWTGYYAKYYGQPNWGAQGSPWTAVNVGQQCVNAGGIWNGAQCVGQQGLQYSQPGYGQQIAQGQVGYAACVRQGNQVAQGRDAMGRAKRFCTPGVPRTTAPQYIQPGYQTPSYGYQTPSYGYQTPAYGTTAAPSVEEIPAGSEEDASGGGILDFFGLTGLGEDAKTSGKAVLVGLAVAGLAYMLLRKKG